MEYTTNNVEVSRDIGRAHQKRVVRQRAKIVQTDANRHPADELQARLLIMEQSLIAMTRFLRVLELDLQDEVVIEKHQTQKRIKRAGSAGRAGKRLAPAPDEVQF